MQQTRLYLDTARIGRISPSARRAHDDFSRLAEDEAASPFFDQFLKFGGDDWSSSETARYPGLAGWRGVSHLKDQLRGLTNTRPDTPLVLANRSAQLMKLAARLFFGPCENVLVTDLGWPVYHEILEGEARRTCRKLTVATIRDGVFREQWNEDEVIDTLKSSFRHFACDGVFLSAVSNLGIRLPVARILSSLEAVGPLRFVVVDGAQELNHIPTDLGHESCDLYLAGAHKWLCGYHPMGLGFYGRRQSRGRIDANLSRLMDVGVIDDPLLRFSTQMETGCMDARTETVSLVPLFSCHGAVSDALRSGPACIPGSVSDLTTLSMQSGWSPLLPVPQMQTAILLLQSNHDSVRSREASSLRERFGSYGVSLTAYPDGMIRVATARALVPDEKELFKSALGSVNSL